MNTSDWTPQREIQNRVAALSKGPWTNHAKSAFAFLKPATPVNLYLAGDWHVPMASVRPLLVAADVARDDELAHFFRAHWKDPEGVRHKGEMNVRDSFDEALTHLQLLELAVEMGYVPLDAIKEQARQQFSELLWSDAARKFVWDYDYLSVGYLASRIGVDISQGDLAPPPVNEAGAVRFALVLAEHVRWSNDEVIDEWLHFLDDYVVTRNEQVLFQEYLLSRPSPTPKKVTVRQRDRFERLAAGAGQFVIQLSTLMAPLREDERAHVGLLYSYWFAKFFGYERGAQGYRKVGDGWAPDVKIALFPKMDSDDDMKSYQESVARRLGTLSNAWDLVRNLDRKSVV